jgi:hypothetical protein
MNTAEKWLSLHHPALERATPIYRRICPLSSGPSELNSTVSRHQAEPEGQNLRRPRQLFVVLGMLRMTGGARPNSTEMNALGVEVRWLELAVCRELCGWTEPLSSHHLAGKARGLDPSVTRRTTAAAASVLVVTLTRIGPARPTINMRGLCARTSSTPAVIATLPAKVRNQRFSSVRTS